MKQKYENKENLLCYCVIKKCSILSCGPVHIVTPKLLGGSNRLDWQLEITFVNCVFQLLEIPCIIC